MTLTEKVAYIKGLMDGFELDKESKEVRVLAAMLDLIDDMAEEVSALGEDFDELDDQVAMIDEDLNAMEEMVYGYEEDSYEVECPSCGEIFLIDEQSAIEGETSCPNCGEEIEVEIEEDEECGCEECGDAH